MTTAADISPERLAQLIDIAMCRRVDGTDWRADMATALRELQALRVSAPAKRISGNGITEPFRFLCLRPDHVDVYDEHVLASDYDKLRAALTAEAEHRKRLEAELAEARRG